MIGRLRLVAARTAALRSQAAVQRPSLRLLRLLLTSSQHVRFQSNEASSLELSEEAMKDGLDSVQQVREREAAPTAKALDEVEKIRSKQFQDLQQHLDPAIYDALTKKPFGYTTMSPVQDAVLSLLPGLSAPLDTPQDSMSGPKDLLVKARTGTGKTLAFLVPALQARNEHVASLNKTMKDQPVHDRRNAIKNSVGALILSPTRELATQIANEAVKLIHHVKNAEVRLFVGGASKGFQLRSWNKGRRDIVVATPGRMLDILQSAPDVADAMKSTRCLILDEADTLLDMGFKDELENIFRYLPDKDSRQTFLFSATVSPAIRQIARSSLKKEHLFIDTVPENESNVHMHIPQYATVLPDPSHQVAHILRLLAQDMLLNPQGGKAIVFLPTTKSTELFSLIVDSMTKHLPWGARKINVFEISSRKTQGQRERAADRFRRAKGGYQILVSSDVSARGVDYPGVTRVIQVGIPGSRDLYIHRVGRTGRAGKQGRGDIVLLPWEVGYMTWQLQDLPLMPLTVVELADQVKALAQTQDELPTEAESDDARRPRGRGFTRDDSVTITGPMAPQVEKRLADLDQAIDQDLFPSLDSFAIKEAFASLLGYYVSKASDIRTTKTVVVQGLKDWAKSGVGLGEEPYVSQQFLDKLGMRDNRTKGRGRDRFDKRGNLDPRYEPGGRVRRSFGQSTENYVPKQPGDHYAAFGRRMNPDDRNMPFGSSNVDRPPRTAYGARDPRADFEERGPPRPRFNDRNDQRSSYGSSRGPSSFSDRRPPPYERS